MKYYSNKVLKNILKIAILILSYQTIQAQTFEFMGVVKLRNNDSEAISYKISFNEKAGKVSGYSWTDISGPYETKNKIEGTYDKKTNTLQFHESNIVYTKSALNGDPHCFVYYKGKIKLESSKAKINGPFQSKFENGKKCIDGTLQLIGSEKVLSIMRKVDKRIQKSKELTPEQKYKYDANRLFDSLTTNQLLHNQNINVFTNTENAEFEIWDFRNEDGDRINFWHNNELILESFEVKNTKKNLQILLKPGKNVFKIEAVNEGKSAPNTAMILLKGDKDIEMLSNLKQGESTSITVIAK
jgi:hypothetical protein